MAELDRPHVWRTITVSATPFPLNPYGEDDFERVSEALDVNHGDGAPGLSMSYGVMEFHFYEGMLDQHTATIVGLLADLGLEGQVVGWIAWTSMHDPRRSPAELGADGE